MKKYIILLLFAGILSSCKKDWLDAKPDKSLIVPSTPQDYQAILDNTNVFNTQVMGIQEIASDDIVLQYSDWQAQLKQEQNSYVWAKDINEGQISIDWETAYTSVLNANLVLEGAGKLNVSGTQLNVLNAVKGSALFLRAFNFYNLAQLFCQPYKQNSSNTDPGVPLRLSANINAKSIRGTVTETYARIIQDLKESQNLLPIVPLYKTRPCKSAAFALLARTYLTISDYKNAGLYADSCLQLQNKLIDYNAVDATAFRPFPLFNDEVIFHATTSLYLSLYYGSVDPVLYNLYSDSDLRKSLFFTPPTLQFQGSYRGDFDFFCGLATDEIYLIRAEAFARQGNANSAIADLNTLLSQRWKTGTYIPYTAKSADDALIKILQERRKELLFRGLRWTDLRRLNQESRFAMDLHRDLNGQTYTLPYNSLRYVFPIPDNEIRLSGIAQNPR